MSSHFVPPTFLALKNPHLRDARISFEEGPHIYTIDDVRGSYTSVTTWNHSHFQGFNAEKIAAGILKKDEWKNDPTYKYYQMPAEEIIKSWKDNGSSASGKGTTLHANIENFYNNEPVKDDSVEYQYFEAFQKDHNHLIPYRTEWMVFHEELKLCGSIDMIFQDPNSDGLYIYDWKRVKDMEYDTKYNKYAITECIQHLPDTNFHHYSLQLNLYKMILEAKYGKKVLGLALVALHPDNAYKTYEKHDVPILTKEVADLIELRKSQVETNM
jgi:ATP-dependent exoDNAse (exonuclease V) beta subunit